MYTHSRTRRAERTRDSDGCCESAPAALDGALSLLSPAAEVVWGASDAGGGRRSPVYAVAAKEAAAPGHRGLVDRYTAGLQHLCTISAARARKERGAEATAEGGDFAAERRSRGVSDHHQRASPAHRVRALLRAGDVCNVGPRGAAGARADPEPRSCGKEGGEGGRGAGGEEAEPDPERGQDQDRPATNLRGSEVSRCGASERARGADLVRDKARPSRGSDVAGCKRGEERAEVKGGAAERGHEVGEHLLRAAVLSG